MEIYKLEKFTSYDDLTWDNSKTLVLGHYLTKDMAEEVRKRLEPAGCKDHTFRFGSGRSRGKVIYNIYPVNVIEKI